MMFRFKVEIIIDEEKVVKDQLYKPKTLYKYIKDVFNYYHLKEVKGNNLNHIVFVDRGNNKDYGVEFGNCMIRLGLRNTL